MSDITKKIFSIEPEGPARTPEPSTSDIIRPALVDTDEPLSKSKEEVPKFVTREAITPLAAPPNLSETEVSSGAGGWIILGLGVLYLIGTGLYFGQPLLKTPVELVSIAGLVLLLTLPVVLLFLLWRTMRHLRQLNLQNARFAKAADILVSPEGEALSRTKTLAAGIQTEISKVNNSLGEAVDALSLIHI